MESKGMFLGKVHGGVTDCMEPIVVEELQGNSCKTAYKEQHTLDNKNWEILNLEEGLACLEGISHLPSLENSFCILQKCRKEKKLAYAKRLYMCICQNGLQNSRLLENYFVSMFVECESMSDAKQVFNRLISRNEYSWTSLIQGYIDSGEWKHGLILFQKMLDDCKQPSKHTFVALLKACARLRYLERGQALHNEIVKEGYEGDLFVGSIMVDMYAKCSLLPEAQQVFDNLLVRDVALWNALIKGYQENGLSWEALDCLVRMQAEGMSPDAVTFVCSLKACSSIGAIERGQEIHAEIKRAGLERDPFVGSALVDMHAKCGSLAIAQEVFDKLQVQDVVLWNTLITGYAECGLTNEALNCLKRMQLQGVPPSTVTLVCSLKACASLGALVRGLEIHTEIAKEGFERDKFIGTSLVDMYAKCGALIEALEVFSKLPSRDVVLCNALVAGYAEQGLSEEALNLLEQMRLEGIIPNALTFACILKACGSLGSLDEGQELHADIVKEGFEADCIVGNTLVRLYAKCGSLVEAEEVFNDMVAHDVVSWNALMAGYLEHGLDEKVLDCLEQIQLEGISSNLATLVCSLRACCRLAAIDRGREVHAEIARERFEKDLFAGTALVDMYAGCGLLVEAQEVFDELPVQDVVLWTALVAGYTEQGLGAEALNCLEQMQTTGTSPNGATYVCSLKACGSITAIDKGQEIHVEIAKQGLENDPFVGNALVDMYAKCGFLAEAREVFNALQAPDVVSWNSIMAGYAEHGFIEKVLDCLEKMQLEAIAPDAVTYICSVKACGGKATIDKGREIHTKVVEDGYERDSSVGNSLVDMYASCGLLAEAQELFDDLPIRNVISWNALIAGYAEQGLGEEVLNRLEQLQQEAVAPDVITYVLSLKACGCIGAIDRGRGFHAEITKKGYGKDPPIRTNFVNICAYNSPEASTLASIKATDVILATALIDMYCRCGSMVDAQQTFDVMATRDLVTWNAFLIGQARQGETENVFQLLERMREEAVQPDGFTFLCVLSVCSHAGLTGKGMKYFEAMRREYGITPTVEHLNCMIDIFGRAGRLDEALIMLEKIPLQPNLVTWNTMLGACHKWGSADLGLHAFECAGEMEEDHAAAFILMSNIYAGANMW